jgi:adenylylsulfate kinase-like enzyme
VASGSGQLVRFKQMKKIDPLLIVFSGLSGAGKTTIAKAFAAKNSAVYVRVDEIEHALKQLSISRDIGPAATASLLQSHLLTSSSVIS